MKQKLFLFIAAVFFCLTAGAQETLYKSTSLIGIWNQLQPYPIDSVRMAWIPTGNFKIYNVDRTFLLFINNGKGLTAITAYGEYDGRKPGEFTETLHFHAYSKELNSGNSKSTLRYKMQNFLLAFSTGATIATKWDGRDLANGGFIIVLKNGQVVCLELFTRNAIGEYLLENTVFDTPSRSRHGGGQLEKIGDDWYFGLQLQVRFDQR